MAASGRSYDPYDFANRRHIGPSAEEIVEMLAVVGAPTLHALIDETAAARHPAAGTDRFWALVVGAPRHRADARDGRPETSCSCR